MKNNGLPLIFIALAVGLFYVYLSPQYAETKLLLGERANYDDVLAKSVELRAVREELRTKLESLSEEDMERLEKMIPQGTDPTRLILDLDNMARRYGIIMTDMSSQVLEEESGKEESSSDKVYETLELTFSFAAPYKNFLSFVQDVESSLRVMDINSILIAEDASDPKNPIYEVTIRSYWLR